MINKWQIYSGTQPIRYKSQAHQNEVFQKKTVLSLQKDFKKCNLLTFLQPLVLDRHP